MLQEAIKTRKGPETVMLTHIWRLSGQILLDVPDCPVQLAEAVYTLMGRDPPDPADSSERTVSEREACLTESLDALSATARTVREQQQAQPAQPQANAADHTLGSSQDGSEQPAQQNLPSDAFQQMQTAMAELMPVDAASRSTEQQFVCQIASAFMSPLLQLFKEQHQQHQAELRRMSSKLAHVEGKLNSIESKLDSNAAFYPLVSVAMGSLTHQVHGLAQYLAANHQAGLARPGQVSPAASPRKLATTPQRKQMQKQDNARNQAKRQLQEAQQLRQQQQLTGQPSALAGNMGQGQDAVPRPINGGFRIVYPGADGEPYWCEWRGV